MRLRKLFTVMGLACGFSILAACQSSDSDDAAQASSGAEVSAENESISGDVSVTEPETADEAETGADSSADAEASDTGSTEAETDTSDSSVQLPGEYPMAFTFSSGAGGWATTLILNSDGSFTGNYSDSEMGEIGDDYPNGSVYVCSFSGTFENIQKVDDNVYTMTISDVSNETRGEEWYEDGVRYVPSDPYGLEEGESYIFYTPDTSTDGLSEEFLSWWPGRYEETTPETLSYYGILNEEMGYGFFAY